MDYEKKYNEALERARRIKNGEDDWRYSDLIEIGPALTEIFPELAESEDERIRKVIYQLMLGMREEIFKSQDEIVTKEKVLAYLEKQKEQKDYNKLYEDIAKSEWFKKAYEGKSLGCDCEQKGQKPAEWSEEDELMLTAVIQTLERFCGRGTTGMQIDWLKSLRPSWKPSVWQMSMLLAVINDPNNAGSESCYLVLKSIYEQLKKL